MQDDRWRNPLDRRAPDLPRSLALLVQHPGVLEAVLPPIPASATVSFVLQARQLQTPEART